ncbi:hypothetical protein DITRI_Ditri03aG0006600 [Diplodiscus trichospermus]
MAPPLATQDRQFHQRSLKWKLQLLTCNFETVVTYNAGLPLQVAGWQPLVTKKLILRSLMEEKVQSVDSINQAIGQDLLSLSQARGDQGQCGKLMV